MKHAPTTVSQVSKSRPLAFALALLLCVCTSATAFAHPKLESSFVKLIRNTVLLRNPRPDADIVCPMFLNQKILAARALEASDDSKYLEVYYEETGDNGYVMAKDVAFITASEYTSIISTNSSAGTYVLSDPTSKYQMPEPVYNVYLTGDNSQPVYNAPGTSSLRSVTARGTPAYVVISEAVTLLAVDGNWGLIEYRTTTGYRRGYIQSSGIPGSAYNRAGAVPKANLKGTTMKKTALVNDTSMTNDAYIIKSMPKGTTITILAFDHSWDSNWAYVETYYENKLVRGFILLETIELS